MQEIATWNEFGTSRIPARSFVKAPFDAHETENKQFAIDALQKAYRNRQPKERALNLLGLKLVGQMQAAIASGIQPVNAPRTIARKGSSKPLIDTGQLRSAITYALDGVEHKGPSSGALNKVLKRIKKLERKIERKSTKSKRAKARKKRK